MHFQALIGSVTVLGILAVGLTTSARAADEVQLPPEITPALRAACESDVRRLCIRDGSTVSTVKKCVISNFLQLGSRCRKEIAIAGLTP